MFRVSPALPSPWADGNLPHGNDDLWDALAWEGRYYLVQKVWCQKSRRFAAFP